MAFDLESISSAQKQRAPRILLLGTPGVGKSEFASSADSPIFIPVKGEEGIDALDVQAFPVIKKYDDLQECMGTLAGAEHNFNTAVIDSGSTLAMLIEAEAMARENVKTKSKLGGGYGHQWDTILKIWTEVIEGLDYLRKECEMVSIIIVHVKVKTVKDPMIESHDKYVCDLDDKVAQMLMKWCDAAWFMHRKTIIKKQDGGFGKEEKTAVDPSKGKRYLYTQNNSPAYEGKGRGLFGLLSEVIELPRRDAWQAVMAELEKATKKKG